MKAESDTDKTVDKEKESNVVQVPEDQEQTEGKENEQSVSGRETEAASQDTVQSGDDQDSFRGGWELDEITIKLEMEGKYVTDHQSEIDTIDNEIPTDLSAGR